MLHRALNQCFVTLRIVQQGIHRVIRSNQLRVAPPAGNTRLFQIAALCRPTRHLTSQAQANVATHATPKAINEKLGENPGARRLTFAAGCAGTPVCMATHTTQMTNAQPEKNSSVNQSISAPTWRCRVGSAKAASVDKAGSARSKLRSGDPVVNVATMQTETNQAGNAM